MARTKKARQKVRDNLASLVASQTTAGIDQGSTQVNGDQESQSESQPAPVTATQSLTKTPYIWTQPAELFLIDELKDAIRRGERVENGFHPRIWDRIMGRFPGEGLERVTRAQLKSKHDSVRPLYGYLTPLLTLCSGRQSGRFSSNCSTSPDGVWTTLGIACSLTMRHGKELLLNGLAHASSEAKRSSIVYK